jgi:anti-sigma factor RsiW
MARADEAAADERLSAYLDDQLEPGETAAFEAFLQATPHAHAELLELRKVVSLVAALAPVEAPADFAENVAKVARRRSLLRGESPALAWLTLPLQVASIVLILAVAAVFMMAQLDGEPSGALERDPAAAPTVELASPRTPLPPAP